MDKIRLKQIRQLNGLTLQTLADKVGSSKCYIWELENKSKNPSAMLLYKIASALRCSMEDLLGKPEIWGQHYPEPTRKYNQPLELTGESSNISDRPE